MNNQPPDRVALDSQTRNRISKELRTNFLVEAAAGTGKTTKIVDRMVNLIATGECEIDHVVAVTFTRKAAAELRVRFEASLRAGAHCPDNEFDSAARQRMQDACNRSNQAFVGTIHSFCTSLLRERPIEFEVDPQFRELTETDNKQLTEDAWHGNIKNLLATKDERTGNCSQSTEALLPPDHC
jgi:ATP-dependent helicase/nuclease subunit A